MNNRFLRVSKGVFDEFLRAKRTLAIRPSSDLEGVREGEVIKLTAGNHDARYTVRAVRKYDNFADAVAGEDWEQMVPHCTEAEQVSAILREFYSPDGRLRNVTVIELMRHK